MNPDDVFTMRGKNVDPVAWEEIRPFAAEAIAQVMTLRPHTGFLELRTSVTRHVVWCYNQGLPLTREVVFDDNVMNRHFDNFDGPAKSVATYRSRVRLAAKVLAGTFVERRNNYVHHVTASSPYSENQIDDILQWTQKARTQSQRDNRLLCVALGLGGGLRPGEIKAVRVGDVCVEGEIVSVTIAGRRVFIHDDYAEIVADGCKDRDAEEFLVFPNFSRRRRVSLSNLFLEFRGDVFDAPDFRRLRSTRIVQLMQAGLPEPVICLVVGLNRLESYHVYRRKYTEKDVVEMRDQIVGREVRLRAV